MINNAKAWLEGHGLAWDTARKIADRIRDEYPNLAIQIKKAYSNAPELELVKLVADAANGSFSKELEARHEDHG